MGPSDARSRPEAVCHLAHFRGTAPAARGGGGTPGLLPSAAGARRWARDQGLLLKRSSRLSRSKTMPSSCPGCGAQMEFVDKEVHLRTGRCDSCGDEFALLAGTTLPVPRSEEGESGPTAAPAAPEVPLPECEECGSPLALRRRHDGSIEARCGECESTTIYVPRAEAEEEEEEEAGPRPRRRAPEGPGGPRGRPCRQCGAPLRFSTNEEGLLVGECDSCGNRFTLRPREGGSGRDSGRFRRGGGGPRGRPYGDRRGGPRWGGPSRGGGRSPRKFRRDSYDSEDADPRTRRRRRSDQ